MHNCGKPVGQDFKNGANYAGQEFKEQAGNYLQLYIVNEKEKLTDSGSQENWKLVTGR